MKIIKIAQGRMDRNNEEMYSTTGESSGKRWVTKIKDDIAKLIDGFDENLMSKEAFELKLKKLIGEMYSIKGARPDPEDIPGLDGNENAGFRQMVDRQNTLNDGEFETDEDDFTS